MSERKYYTAVEHQNTEHTAIHRIFYIPVVAKGGYKHIQTTEAFRAAMAKEHKKRGRWFYLTLPGEYETSYKVWKESCVKWGIPCQDDEIPHYQHTSAWEFYKFIGWDYQRKRFVVA